MRIVFLSTSGQLGTLAPGPFQQFNCIINTVLSLLGAAVATFVLSPALTGKLDMVRAVAAHMMTKCLLSGDYLFH